MPLLHPSPVSILPAGGCKDTLAGLTWEHQIGSTWCWAACYHMVFATFDPSASATQYTVVETVLNLASHACDSFVNHSTPCDDGGLEANEVTAGWGKFKWNAAFLPGVLTSASLADVMKAGRVVEAGITDDPSNANANYHLLLIAGVRECPKNPKTLFYVLDPQCDPALDSDFCNSRKLWISYQTLKNTDHWQSTWTDLWKL